MDRDVDMLDAESSEEKEEKLPDMSALMLSATMVPFPRLNVTVTKDRDVRLKHITDNLDNHLLQARANVKAVATAAVKQRQSARSSKTHAQTSEERVKAQNEEILGWMATRPVPGTSYNVPKPTISAAGTVSGAASESGQSSLTSQVNQIVKTYDDHARATLDFYRQARIRREGEAALPPSKLLAALNEAAHQAVRPESRKPTHRRQASSDIDPTPVKRRATVSEPESMQSTTAVPVNIPTAQPAFSPPPPIPLARAMTAPMIQPAQMLPSPNQDTSAPPAKAMAPLQPTGASIPGISKHSPTNVLADQMVLRYRVHKPGESKDVRELRISGEMSLVAVAQELKKHTGMTSIILTKDGNMLRPNMHVDRPIRNIIGGAILEVSDRTWAEAQIEAAKRRLSQQTGATATTSTAQTPATIVQAQPSVSVPGPAPLVNMTEVNLAADPRRRPVLPKLSTDDVVMGNTPASAPAGPVSANSATPGGKLEPASAAPQAAKKPGFKTGSFVDVARDPRKRR